MSRYFENPFDDPEISAEEFRIFAEDHLGKLRGHNASGSMAGTLTAMLNATTSAFDPFDAALSTRAEQIGSQKTGTATKDEVLQLFRTTMRKREGRVRDKVEKGGSAYGEIFPGGISYYTRATMQTAQQRMDYAWKNSANTRAISGRSWRLNSAGCGIHLRTRAAPRLPERAMWTRLGPE